LSFNINDTVIFLISNGHFWRLASWPLAS